MIQAGFCFYAQGGIYTSSGRSRIFINFVSKPDWREVSYKKKNRKLKVMDDF